MNLTLPYIITVLVCVGLLVAFAGTRQGHGATVTICEPISTTVKLPDKGECITRTIGGYTVTICQ